MRRDTSLDRNTRAGDGPRADSRDAAVRSSSRVALLPAVRGLVLLVAVALAPFAARAGEPSADEQPLQVVVRLRASGEIEAALTKAQELVRTAGAPVEAHLAYQDLMRDLGREEQATNEYKTRAKAEGATADDLFLHARMLRGMKAVTQYRAALKLDATHFRSLCGIGNAQLETGDLRGAEKSFDAARAAKPESGIPWNGLGRSAEARGDRVGAETNYRKAIELAASLTVARVNLGVLLLGTARPKEAMTVLEEAAKAAPKDPLPLVAQGVAHLRSGRDEDALKSFEAALALDSRSAATLEMLAGTYINLNKLDLAAKAVAKALEIAPNSASVQTCAASLALAQADAGAARAAAERAIAIDDDRAMAHFLLARALERQGETKKAEPAYRRAVKIEETNAVFVRGLAQFLGRQDRWKDAVKAFQRVAELSGQAPDALYDLALAEVGANEPKKAVETLEKVVAAQPDHVNAWLKLGILYRERLSDEKKALRAFREHIENGGKDARVRTWIAELEKALK
jgi:Tfp pilus assembly protein PilF